MRIGLRIGISIAVSSVLVILMSQFAFSACGCADFNYDGVVENFHRTVYGFYAARCYYGYGDQYWYWYYCDNENTLAFCNSICQGWGYTGAAGNRCVQPAGSACSPPYTLSQLECQCYIDTTGDLAYLESRYGRTGITYLSGDNRYDLNNDGTINIADTDGCLIPQITVYPSGAPEVCDGLDNNCNWIIDEGCDDDNDNYCESGITYDGDAGTCTAGTGDCVDTNSAVHPGAVEVCNGLDDDCNPATVDGSGESFPLNTNQQGVCAGSTQ